MKNKLVELKIMRKPLAQVHSKTKSVRVFQYYEILTSSNMMVCKRTLKPLSKNPNKSVLHWKSSLISASVFK